MHVIENNGNLSSLTSAQHVRPRLGIIGGGQLAKMTAVAALKLGCDVTVLERNPHTPAGNMTSKLLLGDWDDPATLALLAAEVDVVTLENEFVNADSLESLERTGAVLYPSSQTLWLIQDKMLQKQFCQEAGLETVRWLPVNQPEDVRAAGDQLGWPLLLKARRNAYDGKGNETVSDASQVDHAWSKLQQAGELYVEEFCPFISELAIIVTRSRGGSIVSYPVVESVQKNHVCHLTIAPANIPSVVAESARQQALKLVEKLNGVGSFGIELFQLPDGRAVINEIAPRVHNTGHFTIEACACSQFENHVRAIMGWPLGSSQLIVPAAVMVNLLGKEQCDGTPRGLDQALAVDRASVHLYGKLTSQPGRKMGHVTAVGQTIDAAKQTALNAAAFIHFGDPS